MLKIVVQVIQRKIFIYLIVSLDNLSSSTKPLHPTYPANWGVFLSTNFLRHSLIPLAMIIRSASVVLPFANFKVVFFGFFYVYAFFT